MKLSKRTRNNQPGRRIINCARIIHHHHDCILIFIILVQAAALSLSQQASSNVAFSPKVRRTESGLGKIEFSEEKLWSSRSQSANAYLLQANELQLQQHAPLAPVERTNNQIIAQTKETTTSHWKQQHESGKCNCNGWLCYHCGEIALCATFIWRVSLDVVAFDLILTGACKASAILLERVAIDKDSSELLSELFRYHEMRFGLCAMDVETIYTYIYEKARVSGEFAVLYWSSRKS